MVVAYQYNHSIKNIEELPQKNVFIFLESNEKFILLVFDEEGKI